MNKHLRENIYAVNPEANYLQELAKLTLSLAGGDFIKLAKIKVILPNNRSQIFFKEELINLSTNKAAIMPEIFSLGGADEDSVEILKLLGEEDELEIATAIEIEERIFLLSKIIHDYCAEREKIESYEGVFKGISLEQVIGISRSICSLIDEFDKYDKNPSDLKKALEDELPEFKSEGIEFLEDILERYNQTLKAKGLLNPIERRNKVIRRYCEAVKKIEPENDLIIAGSTGTMPATRELIKAVFELKNGKGHIVLPYIDLVCGAEEWLCAGNSEDGMIHQKTVFDLLKFLNVARDDLKILGGNISDIKSSNKANLISKIYTPTNFLKDWKNQDFQLKIENDTHLISAKNQILEAKYAGILIKKALSENKKVALITSDDNIASYTKYYLKELGVNIDDSTGGKLLESGEAEFYLRLLRVCVGHDNILGIIFILNSCFINTNLKITSSDINKCELAFRKHFVRTIDDIKEDLLLPKPCADFIYNIKKLKESFKANNKPEFIIKNFNEFIKMIVGEDAFLKNDIFDIITTQTQKIGKYFFNKDLVLENILREILSDKTYRKKETISPRAFILSPIEARLICFDTIIWAGLNLDIFPSKKKSSWLNNKTRDLCGLPNDNFYYNLSAHDFLSHMHAKEIYLTNSIYINGTPSVESNMMGRMDKYYKQFAPKGLGYESARSVQKNLEAVFDEMLSSKTTHSKEATLANAPKDLRPKRASITEIEKIVANPYGYYAKHVLKLRELDNLLRTPDARDFGNFLHEVVEKFTDFHDGDISKITLTNFFDIAKDVFDKWKDEKEVSVFWESQYARLAGWFVNIERRRFENIKNVYTEIEGKFTTNEGFTLSGKIDRIEISNDNKISIFDYKTGGVPKKVDVEKLRAPQLILSLLMAKKGLLGKDEEQQNEFGESSLGAIGIGGVGMGEVGYYKLGFSEGGNDFIELDFEKEILSLMAETEQNLKNLANDIADETKSFLAYPEGYTRTAYPEFAHLARTVKDD